MNIKKFTSLLTALCFLVTFVGQSISWASPGAAPSEIIGAAEFKKIFEDIPQIPSQYGKITGVSNLGSKNIVVNIQDLHCHPEAQKNICKIIEILDKNYNVRSVYVEGAYDKIDISWLSSIEDKTLRNTLAQQMVNDGRLNASEYYAVTNDKKDFLLGIEDKEKHEENIQRLGYILSRQDAYSETLSNIHENMNYWDAKYTNIKNKRFNRTLEKYRKGEMEAGKFYALLAKYMNKINENPEQYNNVLPITMSSYPNIQNFMYVTRAKTELDMKTVQMQLQALLAYLKGKLPPQAFQIFLDETDNLSNIDRLAAALSNFSTMFNINLDVNYSQLNMFFKLQDLSRNINPLDLIAEERHITERLRAALSYDQTEAEISFLNDFSGYFSDYLQNKLMANDFAYFETRFDKFKELYSKYTVVNDLTAVEKDFDLLNAYYRLNDERNEIFAEKIFKYWQPDSEKSETPALNNADKILKNAKEIIIVVTGGYHSQGTKELFAKKGITDIIITPTITTEIHKAELIYEELIMQQNIFLKEALAFTIASQAGEQTQFEALVLAGISLIKSSPYSSNNIDKLAAEIKKAVHNSDIKITYGDNETTFRFRDGKTVTLMKDSEGMIALKAKGMTYALKEKKSARIKKDFSALANKVIQNVPSEGAASLLVPDSEAFLKWFINFAGKNQFYNILNNDGLIIEVSDYMPVKRKQLKAISAIDLTTFGKLPAPLQKVLFDYHLRSQQSSPAQLRLKRIAGSVRRTAAAIFLALSFAQTPAQTQVFPTVGKITMTAKQIMASPDASGAVYHFATGNNSTQSSERTMSEENINNSLRESEKKENLDLVNEAYGLLQTKLGLDFSRRYPVLLLQNTNTDRTKYAAADVVNEFIVFPSDALKQLSRNEQVAALAAHIAREATRIDANKNPELIKKNLGSLLPDSFYLTEKNYSMYDEAAAWKVGTDAAIALKSFSGNEQDFRKMAQNVLNGLIVIGEQHNFLSSALNKYTEGGTLRYINADMTLNSDKTKFYLADSKNTGNTYEVEINAVTKEITGITVKDKNGKTIPVNLSGKTSDSTSRVNEPAQVQSSEEKADSQLTKKIELARDALKASNLLTGQEIEEFISVLRSETEKAKNDSMDNDALFEHILNAFIKSKKMSIELRKEAFRRIWLVLRQNPDDNRYIRNRLMLKAVEYEEDIPLDSITDALTAQSFISNLEPGRYSFQRDIYDDPKETFILVVGVDKQGRKTFPVLERYNNETGEILSGLIGARQVSTELTGHIDYNESTPILRKQHYEQKKKDDNISKTNEESYIIQNAKLRELENTLINDFRSKFGDNAEILTLDINAEDYDREQRKLLYKKLVTAKTEREKLLAMLSYYFALANKGSQRGDLNDGFTNVPAFNRAGQYGSDFYASHGMGKSNIATAVTDLLKLFTDGIDPNRGGGLYTDSLTNSSGIHTGATAGGTSYRDGPFILVGKKGYRGQFTDINQVGGILVNNGITDAHPEIIDLLKQLFPNLVVESYNNTAEMVQQLNDREALINESTIDQSREKENLDKLEAVIAENKRKDNGNINAILDRNKAKVAQMIEQGVSSIKIAWFIAKSEFLASLNPARFIAGHTTRGGKIGAGIISTLTYLPLLATGAVLAFNPVSLALAAAILTGSFIVGAALNLSAHTAIDWHFVEKIERPFKNYDEYTFDILNSFISSRTLKLSEEDRKYAVMFSDEFLLLLFDAYSAKTDAQKISAINEVLKVSKDNKQKIADMYSKLAGAGINFKHIPYVVIVPKQGFNIASDRVISLSIKNENNLSANSFLNENIDLAKQNQINFSELLIALAHETTHYNDYRNDSEMDILIAEANAYDAEVKIVTALNLSALDPSNPEFNVKEKQQLTDIFSSIHSKSDWLKQLLSANISEKPLFYYNNYMINGGKVYLRIFDYSENNGKYWYALVENGTLKIYEIAANDQIGDLIGDTKINDFKTDDLSEKDSIVDKLFTNENAGFEAISKATDTQYLVNIINSKNIPVILKFAAFNRLDDLNYDLSVLGETLAKEAEPLLQEYIKDMRNDILADTPHRDAKIGAIGAAAIFVLKLKYPQIIKLDYNAIAKETAKFRWGKKTFANKDVLGIEFGADFIKGEQALLVFLPLVVHGFAHKIQFELAKNFESDKMNDTISEMFADSLSFLLAAELGFDTTPFKENLKYENDYESVVDPSKDGIFARTFDDPYHGARSFLLLLIRNNGKDLSAGQAAKLAESIFNIIEESSNVYGNLDQETRGNFVGDKKHYFGGAAVYFAKILTLWSGAQVNLPEFEFRDRQYGQLPANEVFAKAVADNAKTDSRLELPETAAEADRFKLTGVKRALFAARREFEQTFLPDFVDMHYGEQGPTETEKASDAYKMRVKGDKIIKTATKITQAICFGRITKLVRAVNIITHAIYNLANPGAKLSLAESQDKNFHINAETAAKLESFYAAVTGNNPKDLNLSVEQLALTYYVLNDLTSLDLNRYAEITNLDKAAVSDLAANKAAFLAALTPQQRKTFIMLETAKNTLNSEKPNFALIESSFGELIDYMRQYVSKYGKENPKINLNSPEVVMFLAALDLMPRYVRSLGLSNDDVNALFPYISDVSYMWRTYLDLASNSQNGQILTNYLMNTSTLSFAQMYRVFGSNLTVKITNSFKVYVFSLDKKYGPNMAIPKVLLEDMESFASYVEKTNHAEETFEEIVKKNPENPAIVKFCNEKLKALKIKTATKMLEVFLRQKTELLDNIPDIGDSVKYRDYKKQLNLSVNAIADSIKTLKSYGVALPVAAIEKAFPDGELAYLELIENRNNPDFLRGVFNDTANRPLNLRLFALMYLKANAELDKKTGNPIEKIDTTAIAKEYHDSMKTFEVRNNFDLRASIMGVHLLLVPEFKITEGMEYAGFKAYASSDNLFAHIAEAVILKLAPYSDDSFNAGANSGLNFTTDNTDPGIIAHELGHNYLYVLAPELNTAILTHGTLHELFAYTIEGALYSLLGNFSPYFITNSLTARLFDKNDQSKQEIHDAAKGFLGITLQIFKHIGYGFSYQHLAQAIMLFSKAVFDEQSSFDISEAEGIVAKVFPELTQEMVQYAKATLPDNDRTQSAMFTSFVIKYAAFLAKNFPETGVNEKELISLYRFFGSKIGQMLLKRKQLIDNAPDSSSPNTYAVSLLASDISIALSFDESTKDLLKYAYTDSEIEYLYILRDINSEEKLEETAKNAPNIKHRMYAMMLLKTKGHKGDFGDLINEFTRQLKNSEIIIDNNFDLRAVLAGMHAATVSSDTNKGKIFFKNSDAIYQTIASAARINKGAEDNRDYHGYIYVTEISGIGLKEALRGLYYDNTDNNHLADFTQLRNTMESIFRATDKSDDILLEEMASKAGSSPSNLNQARDAAVYFMNIASSADHSPIVRMSALNKLQQLNALYGELNLEETINRVGAALTEIAPQMIKDYLENNKDIFAASKYRDEKLAAVNLALFIHLKNSSPPLIAADYNELAKIANKTTFLPNDTNAHADMRFGGKWIDNSFSFFIGLAAHEFGHAILEQYNFPLQGTVNEIFADTIGFIAVSDFGLNFDEFYDKMSFKKHFDKVAANNMSFNEEHDGARAFLQTLINANKGNLSREQAQTLATAILDAAKEAAALYADTPTAPKIGINLTRSFDVKGMDWYFNTILSKWAGKEAVYSPAADRRIPNEQILTEAVENNKKVIAKMAATKAEIARERATAKRELIFTAAASLHPILRDFFIWFHGSKKKDPEKFAKRQEGMDRIKNAMKKGWNDAASKVTSQFAFIRLIQRYAFGIAGALDANIDAHVEHNLANPRSKLELGSVDRMSLSALMDKRSELLEKVPEVSANEKQNEEYQLDLLKIEESIASKASLSFISRSFSEDEGEYFKIMKTGKTDSKDIKHRLFAMMHHKKDSPGSSTYSSEEEALLEEFKRATDNAEIEINNNFAMRAVLAGTQALMYKKIRKVSEKIRKALLLSQFNQSKIFSKISSAAKLKASTAHVGASTSLAFGEAGYLQGSHELGHINLNSAATRDVYLQKHGFLLHEIFAYAAQFMMSDLRPDLKYTSYDNVEADKKGVANNPDHKVAGMFLALSYKVFEDSGNMYTTWDEWSALLLEAIAEKINSNEPIEDNILEEIAARHADLIQKYTDDQLKVAAVIKLYKTIHDASKRKVQNIKSGKNNTYREPFTGALQVVRSSDPSKVLFNIVKENGILMYVAGKERIALTDRSGTPIGEQHFFDKTNPDFPAKLMDIRAVDANTIEIKEVFGFEMIVSEVEEFDGVLEEGNVVIDIRSVYKITAALMREKGININNLIEKRVEVNNIAERLMRKYGYSIDLTSALIFLSNNTLNPAQINDIVNRFYVDQSDTRVKAGKLSFFSSSGKAISGIQTVKSETIKVKYSAPLKISLPESLGYAGFNIVKDINGAFYLMSGNTAHVLASGADTYFINPDNIQQKAVRIRVTGKDTVEIEELSGSAIAIEPVSIINKEKVTVEVGAKPVHITNESDSSKVGLKIVKKDGKFHLISFTVKDNGNIKENELLTLEAGGGKGKRAEVTITNPLSPGEASLRIKAVDANTIELEELLGKNINIHDNGKSGANLKTAVTIAKQQNPDAQYHRNEIDDNDAGTSLTPSAVSSYKVKGSIDEERTLDGIDPQIIEKAKKATFRLFLGANHTMPMANLSLVEFEIDGKPHRYLMASSHALKGRDKQNIKFTAGSDENNIRPMFTKAAFDSPSLDIILLEVPDNMPADLANIEPLKMSITPAKQGDRLFSLGYPFDEEFMSAGYVQNENAYKGIFSSMQPRDGTCGSAVLNMKGEVIGIRRAWGKNELLADALKINSDEAAKKPQFPYEAPIQAIHDFLKLSLTGQDTQRSVYLEGQKAFEMSAGENITNSQYFYSTDGTTWQEQEIKRDREDTDDTGLSVYNNLGSISRFFKNPAYKEGMMELTLTNSITGKTRVVTVYTEGKKLLASPKQTPKGNKIFEELKGRISGNVPTTIAFVCSGNVNRSALSHVIFEQEARKHNKTNIKINSAATDVSLSPENQISLRDKYKFLLDGKVDNDILDAFKSENLSDEQAKADYIIVPEEKHRTAIVNKYPALKNKIFLYHEILPDADNAASATNLTKNEYSNEDLVNLVEGFAERFFGDDANRAAERAKAVDSKDKEKPNAASQNPLATEFKKDSSLSSMNSLSKSLQPANHIKADFGNIFAGNYNEDNIDELVDQRTSEMIKPLISGRNLKNALFSFTLNENGTQVEDDRSLEIANNVLLSIADNIAAEIAKTNPQITAFAISELLANAFAHGNKLDLSKPIHIYISENLNEIFVINTDSGTPLTASQIAAAVKANIFGAGLGVNNPEDYLFSRTSLGETPLFIASFVTSNKIEDRRKSTLVKINKKASFNKPGDLGRTNPAFEIPELQNGEEITVQAKDTTFKIANQNGKLIIKDVEGIPITDSKGNETFTIIEENGRNYLTSPLRFRFAEKTSPAAKTDSKTTAVPLSNTLAGKMNAAQTLEIDLSKELDSIKTGRDAIESTVRAKISAALKGKSLDKTLLSFSLSRKPMPTAEKEMRQYLQNETDLISVLSDVLAEELSARDADIMKDPTSDASMDKMKNYKEVAFELLKNAFTHGNRLDLAENVYVYIGNKSKEIYVANKINTKEMSKEMLAIATDMRLFGGGVGTLNYENYSFLRTTLSGENIFIANITFDSSAKSERDALLKNFDTENKWEKPQALTRTLPVIKLPALSNGEQVAVTYTNEETGEEKSFNVIRVNDELKFDDAETAKNFSISIEKGIYFLNSPYYAAKISSKPEKTTQQTAVDAVEQDFKNIFNKEFSKLGTIKDIKKLADSGVFLITTADNKKYVLKSIAKEFAGEKRDPRYFTAFFEHLQKSNIPHSKLVKTNSGKGFVDSTDRFYMLNEFIDNVQQIPLDSYTEKNYNSLINFVTLLQKTMQSFDAKWISAASENARHREDEINEISQQQMDNTFDKQTLPLMSSEFKKVKENLNKIQKSSLKKSYVHGDLHMENVMFDKNGNIAGIIDFELLAYDYRIYEFLKLFLYRQYVKKLTKSNIAQVLNQYQKQNSGNELSADEIKAFIEHMRFQLIRYSMRVQNDPEKKSLYFKMTSEFAADFSNDHKINDFINEVNKGITTAQKPAVSTQGKQETAKQSAVQELAGKLNIKDNDIIDLDFSKVFTDFKKPDYKKVDLERELDTIGMEHIATPEIRNYIDSLFMTGKRIKTYIPLNNTAITLNLSAAAGELSKENYRLATNILLIVAKNITASLKHHDKSGMYKDVAFLERDIFEVLKNALAYGNALDLSKPITIVINDEGIFIINEESGQKPSLKQRALASWAKLYGQGAGLIATSASSGYMFSRINVGNRKLFIAALSKNPKAIKMLRALDPKASWHNQEEMERTEMSYKVTEIAAIEEGFELKVNADGTKFTITKQNGILEINDLETLKGPDRLIDSKGLKEKLEIESEDGLSYLITTYRDYIDFGKPYKSELLKQGISRQQADLINRVAQKYTGAKTITAIVFIANLPKMLTNALSSLFTPSKAKYILVNYHFIKQSGIVSAVREFGAAATLTAEGYVNLPVYAINDEPENYVKFNEDFKFENTGISINGKPLWISTSRGAVVVYAEGVSKTAIAKEMATNRKINNIIKQSAGIKTNIKNISVDWIEVDHNDMKKTITYSKDGNITVSNTLFSEMLRNGEMLDFTASLRKTKNNDGYTLARGLLHHLDDNDVTTVEDFIEYLKLHKKIGNGQIVINPKLANTIGVERLSTFLNQARKDGVEVYLLTETSEMLAVFKKAGFSGFVYPALNKETKRNGFEMYNFVSGETSQLGTSKDFDPNLSLEENIERAGAMVMLNNSELKAMLDKEKSGLFISDIIEAISSLKVLKMFTPEKMTPEFALRVARNFEITDMPEKISQEKLNTITDMYTAKDFDGIINALGLPQSHPISVYITKIKSQTDDKEVYNSFVIGIAEKILTANSLRKAHKANGLQDKTFEILLGRALLLQAITKETKGAGVSVDHNTLGTTMTEAESKLYEALQGLIPEAFNNKKPEAINAIAELIPAIAAERRKRLTKDDIKPEMDIQSYESILGAA